MSRKSQLEYVREFGYPGFALYDQQTEPDPNHSAIVSDVSLSDLSRETLTVQEFTDRASEYLNPDLETFLRSSNLPFAIDAYLRSQNRKLN
jgi:hypothetical protein